MGIDALYAILVYLRVARASLPRPPARASPSFAEILSLEKFNCTTARFFFPDENSVNPLAHLVYIVKSDACAIFSLSPSLSRLISRSPVIPFRSFPENCGLV